MRVEARERDKKRKESHQAIESTRERERDTHTDFFPQSRGVRQGCSLSPTLGNIYINQLARALEQSAAPSITLVDTQIKCLLFADELGLLSPTREGLQQHLDLLLLSDLGPDSEP